MRISIMGDSISTYEGCNPHGYAVQYIDAYARENGLRDVDDTWWRQVISARDYELVVNDAFSGSLVCGDAFPAACSEIRARSVAGTDTPPDAVLFYIGVNDFGYCAPLERFENDYALMLDRVAETCPGARLICATIMKSHVAGYGNWAFPCNQAGLDLDDYNAVIRTVIAEKDAELADLAAYGETYETLDGVHPTRDGMKTIAQAWLRCLAPKVSIVMPVYNTERYLEECLTGVREQTLADIEVICVDDGSTDRSASILDRIAAEDPRFHVIHKPNEGYGVAMNVGMAAATGDYIGVVEPDDLVDPEMFETLWRRAVACDADVVKGDFYDFCDTPEGRIENYRQICPTTLMYGPVLNATANASLLFCVMMTWEGIYRRSFLERIGARHNTTPGASFQDNGFWWQVFTSATRVVFVNEAHYRYRVGHAGSSNMSSASALRIATEYAYVRANLEAAGLWESYAQVFSYFYFDNLIARAPAIEPADRADYASFIGNEWAAYLERGEAERSLLPDFLSDQLDAIAANPSAYDPAAWPSIATVSWDEVSARRGEAEIRHESVNPYAIVSTWTDCIVEEG